jgi:hypothetical protein
MADLIRGLIQVKDPLTLFAFLSLVFLAAFRTKRVPELFFGLAHDKLTKERFSQLLHRFILYGFVGFVLLCGTAVTGQVLAMKTRSQPISLDDLRAELKNLNVPEAQKQNAASAYSQGIAYIEQHDFDNAIQSLQSSINAVPSLAAQYTLAYLYQKKGDTANASSAAAVARSMANEQHDNLAQVRLDQLAIGAFEQTEKDSLVGAKSPLPEGGKSFEEATWISPGLYILTKGLGNNELRHFKIRLKAGQTLAVKFRNPEAGGYTAATIYDSDGGAKTGNYVSNRSQVFTVSWNFTADTQAYITIGSDSGVVANGVYRISVR